MRCIPSGSSRETAPGFVWDSRRAVGAIARASLNRHSCETRLVSCGCRVAEGDPHVCSVPRNSGMSIMSKRSWHSRGNSGLREDDQPIYSGHDKIEREVDPPKISCFTILGRRTSVGINVHALKRGMVVSERRLEGCYSGE